MSPGPCLTVFSYRWINIQLSYMHCINYTYTYIYIEFIYLILCIYKQGTGSEKFQLNKKLRGGGSKGGGGLQTIDFIKGYSYISLS